jgi:thiol-disulfide isomerase/thioredoxin
MIKLLLSIALGLSLQMANAQKDKVFYKTETGKIITEKQLNERVDRLKKVAQQISKKAKVNPIFLDTLNQKDSTIISFKLAIDAEGIDIASDQKNKIEENLLQKQFPAYSLHNLENEIINSEKYKGKPTMINFWFKNCAPCIDEMPALNKLKEKYQDQVHFVAITFNIADEVKNFLSENKFHFEHLVNAQTFCNELEIKSYPTNIFLDKTGKVVQVENGIPYMMDENGKMKPGDETYFEKFIKKLL